VLIDGELINQFDNSVPKIASRNGDPPTMARQLAEGYLGLQTHGGNDRISYREIQVKDVSEEEIPVNVEPPEVGGSGRVGKALTCGRGEWETRGRAEYWVTWYRSNPIGPQHPRYRAPSQFDLGDFTTPAEEDFGTQDLRWTDSLIVGNGKKYTPTAGDAGNAIHCSVSADTRGATVWATASATEITAN
jgi:hypothetical protein